MPGYRPYCPFTTDPNGSGAWVGPNLPPPKLVAASGTAGSRMEIWSDTLAPDPITAAFIVSVLRKLGCRPPLHTASFTAVVHAANNPRSHLQVADGLWYADYPSASDFFDLYFRCSAFQPHDPAATTNGAGYCNPAADRLMNRADRQQTTDPAQAAATWAAVNRRVTYDAPWVILANLNNVNFLSAQVTNYQYNPFLGILLDQLQIRRPQSPSARPQTTPP